MFKELELRTTEGPKTFGMQANGATCIRFRAIFHKDIMIENAKLLQGADDADSEYFAKLAYIMNASAEKKDMSKLSQEGYEQWLEQFEGSALWDAQAQIAAVYTGNTEVTSTGKN
ncbi:MAG: hypothetical protein IJ675_05370 [Pseudobutyrivibrio sp.]|nr:hypothetical protein [Pseudobutyrivibrio sp.]